MSNDTFLDFLNLNDQLIEASVRQGRIHVQLRDLGDGESVEIEIPRGSLWLLQSGAYDIETPGSSDQPARITVFEGKARFVGGAADVPIAAGEEIQVTGAYPAIETAKRTASGANPTPASAASAPRGPTFATAGPPTVTAGANPAGTDVRSGAPIQANPGPTNAQSAPSDDFLSWVGTSKTDAASAQDPKWVQDRIEETRRKIPGSTQPGRRIGVLNYVSGDVNYALRSNAGSLNWSGAEFNQPVSQDMSLQTGPLARARIRIGPNAIQMSNDTLLDFLKLNDQLIEASVRQGRIHVQLRDLGDGESVEIDIPRGSLWLLQSGAYDIETPGSSDQPARITVFEGKARFVGGAADVPIAAGEEIQVTGAYPAIVTTQRGASNANPMPTNAGQTTPR